MSANLLGGGLQNILDFIAAAGGLGTAAFGLVDATKAFGGGVSNAGFGYIRNALERLIGKGSMASKAFGKADIFATLKANWMNGVAKSNQKATAKSLIRLTLNKDNAANLAKATGIDPNALENCIQNIYSGVSLTQQDINLLGQFDAVVSAILDEAYERADQQYRNQSKLLAGIFAVLLAAVGGCILYSGSNPENPIRDYFVSSQFIVAVFVGIIATPLAPIAKDLSTSLNAAVKAVSTIKR